jgi:AcrR family transcriptional regulator
MQRELQPRAARDTHARLSTRERILDKAERLIAVRGVFGFTLKDIAEPLEVQVPAIYKHYASRDDVLLEVSRRFVDLLSREFTFAPDELANPSRVLHTCIDSLVDFHVSHPAYVRLSLTDFATPEGGMEYIKRAAGGNFRANLRTGPLAPMHRRLRNLVRAGIERQQFRAVDPLDLYRLIKSTLLIRLVFPDDALLTGPKRVAEVKRIKAHVWEVTTRYLAPESTRHQRRTIRARS